MLSPFDRIIPPSVCTTIETMNEGVRVTQGSPTNSFILIVVLTYVFERHHQAMNGNGNYSLTIGGWAWHNSQAR